MKRVRSWNSLVREGAGPVKRDRLNPNMISGKLKMDFRDVCIARRKFHRRLYWNRMKWWEMPPPGVPTGKEWLRSRNEWDRLMNHIEKAAPLTNKRDSVATRLAHIYGELANSFTPDENARMVKAMYALASGESLDGVKPDHRNQISAAEWLRVMLRDVKEYADGGESGPQSVTNSMTINLQDPEVLKAVLKLAEVRGMLPGHPAKKLPEPVDGPQGKPEAPQ